MNKLYLKKLEYDQILQKLSEYCHTYIGKEKALCLEPSSDKEFVNKFIEEVINHNNLTSEHNFCNNNIKNLK